MKTMSITMIMMKTMKMSIKKTSYCKFLSKTRSRKALFVLVDIFFISRKPGGEEEWHIQDIGI